MGRGKLRVELIRNEKSRKLTFKKRKEGLIKKLHELTTLCDVSACMIISEAAPANNHQEQPAVDHIWPPNPEKFRRIIESYEAKKNDSSRSKVITFGLSDFFRDRQKKIEEELAELRRKNMEAKYPICHEILNTLTEAQLREFGAALENKAQIMKSRIEFLKMMISTKQLESSVDFAAKKNWNLDDQETASSYSSVMMMMMMMDFAPERLGLNQPLKFDDANWNIVNEQEITDDSSLMVDFAPERFGLDSNSFRSLNVEQEVASSSSLSAAVDHEQNYLMMNENFDEFEFAYSSINGNNFQQCYWENLEEDVFQYNDSLWS